MFELILQYHSPVAAIIPERLATKQLLIIYMLLPGRPFNQPELAARWNVALVISSDDWAREQLRRNPMLKPRGVTLVFGGAPTCSRLSAPQGMAALAADTAAKISQHLRSFA